MYSLIYLLCNIIGCLCISLNHYFITLSVNIINQDFTNVTNAVHLSPIQYVLSYFNCTFLELTGAHPRRATKILQKLKKKSTKFVQICGKSRCRVFGMDPYQHKIIYFIKMKQKK